jgi:hypothetical protein
MVESVLFIVSRAKIHLFHGEKAQFSGEKNPSRLGSLRRVALREYWDLKSA